MTTQESGAALLSSDRQSQATATDTSNQTQATETDPNKDKPEAGADTATPGDKAKPDGEKPDGEDTDASKAETEGGQTDSEEPPETYQFEAPDGVTVDMEDEGAKEFVAYLKETKKSQAEASRLFGMLTKQILAIRDAQQAAWDQESEVDWVEAVAKDADIGGDKAKVEQNLGVAKLALDKFGDADLDAVMTRFRLGNNPAVVRFMYRVGLTLKETGTVPRSGQRSQERLSDAEVFFPDQNAA